MTSSLDLVDFCSVFFCLQLLSQVEFLSSLSLVSISSSLQRSQIPVGEVKNFVFALSLFLVEDFVTKIAISTPKFRGWVLWRSQIPNRSQIERLSTIKLYKFLRFTTFILVVSPSEIVWKIQILNLRHSNVISLDKMISNEKVVNYKVL